MLGDRVADAVVGLAPGAAAEEAVVAAVAFDDERALDRVPVPRPSVPRALGREEVPVGERPDDRPLVAAEPIGAVEAVDDDARSDPLTVEEVVAIEQVPAPVVVLERVGIDRERLIGVDQFAGRPERALGRVGEREPEPVV
jgi:hypothetical protein